MHRNGPTFYDGQDSGRFQSTARSIQCNDWDISFGQSCILPSVCSTSVVCQREGDELCQFCIYSKELTIPHLPDMVFPKNNLTLIHKTTGATINFNALDALKCVSNTTKPIEVACSDAWMGARPDAEKMKKSFDWTFTTDYKGTLNENFLIEPTDETMDLEMLKKKDHIVFYHDSTLFEDELHDHGIAKLSAKIRLMPTYWYILLRYFLRVDDVMVRSIETRMFHRVDIKSDYILREYTVKESDANSLNMPTWQMNNPDEVVAKLPVKENQMHKLIMLPKKEP